MYNIPENSQKTVIIIQTNALKTKMQTMSSKNHCKKVLCDVGNALIETQMAIITTNTVWQNCLYSQEQQLTVKEGK